MTRQQVRNGILIGVGIFVTTGFLAATIGAVWRTKLDTDVFRIHILEEREMFVRDSAWKADRERRDKELLSISLATLCELRPKDTQCLKSHVP